MYGGNMSKTTHIDNEPIDFAHLYPESGISIKLFEQYLALTNADATQA